MRRAPGAHDIEALDWPGVLDKAPLARGAAYPRRISRLVAEERPSNRFEIRLTSHHDQDGQLERCRQRMNVDDVETAHGDPLKEHGAHVAAKLAVGHELHHASRRVCPVATNGGPEDAVEPCTSTHGPHQKHGAAVRAQKRPVVEADDVQSNNTPGFMIPFGSKAFLMPFMRASFTGSSSFA